MEKRTGLIGELIDLWGDLMGVSNRLRTCTTNLNHNRSTRVC